MMGEQLARQYKRSLRASGQPSTLSQTRLTAVAEVYFVPSQRYEHSAPLRYVGLRLLKAQGSLFADGSDRHYHALVTVGAHTPVTGALRSDFPQPQQSTLWTMVASGSLTMRNGGKHVKKVPNSPPEKSQSLVLVMRTAGPRYGENLHGEATSRG